MRNLFFLEQFEDFTQINIEIKMLVIIVVGLLLCGLGGT